MSVTTIGILGLVILVALIFLRMPVGFAMGFMGIVGFACVISFDAAASVASKDVISMFSSYDLSVMPLFILMGQLAFEGGMAEKLYECAYTFLGRLKGGLTMATIGASALFASVCGSTNASAATMATVSLPVVKKFNYNPAFAAATAAAGGSLGILIPPSIVLIIYGVITETDIGKLFAAGIFPGILLSILFIIGIAVAVKIDPTLGPKGPKTTAMEKFFSLKGIVDTALLFLLLMGGLFFGFFTPTEAAAFGVLGVAVFLAIRRRLSWKVFRNAIAATAKISCMIYIIAAGAIIFGHFVAITRIPFDLATWIGSLNLSPTLTISLIFVGYLIGGCFLDSLAMLLLTVPIFLPLLVSLGFDPVWFGVIMIIVCNAAVITPPVGINAYVVAMVTEVPLEDIFRQILPFLFAELICFAILVAFPEIATFLPSLMGK